MSERDLVTPDQTKTLTTTVDTARTAPPASRTTFAVRSAPSTSTASPAALLLLLRRPVSDLHLEAILIHHCPRQVLGLLRLTRLALSIAAGLGVRLWDRCLTRHDSRSSRLGAGDRCFGDGRSLRLKNSGISGGLRSGVCVNGLRQLDRGSVALHLL